jgi:prepilin-type N-terminal cleavage/methylation domain-containing protein
MRHQRGFSLIELIIAMAVMLTVTGSVFTLMNPAQGSFAAQPEVSDMQQRLRVATDTLYKDLIMTGGGAYQGSMSGSLGNFFAAVQPRRIGSTNADGPTVFKADTISLVYVPATIAQTSLKAKSPNQKSVELAVESNQDVPPAPGCPAADELCGFKENMTVLMYDDSGNYDIFTITNVQGSALHLQHNTDQLTYTEYAPVTTKIVQVSNFVYYFNAATNQLMFYDGGPGADVPVVDNVVGLAFEYFGEPQPPTWRPGKNVKNSAETGPWTSYGPKPAALDTPSWPAGENCIFTFDGVTPQSRLPALGAPGTGLVKLTAAQLTDGPWCPNAASPNRWDADLLRVRKIGITIRVQAANAALRGPASALFTRGGTSKGGEKWVPDQEIRFQVSPRNLNLGR